MESVPWSIRIVPARDERREFVRALSAEVFARFGDYESLLARMMDLPWVLTVTAEADGLPVGFAMYSLEDVARGEVDLTAIAVEPRWQSRGVGRALLEWVEQAAVLLAPAGGPAVVRLTVAADNDRARALFGRCGYREGPGDDGVYPAGQRSLQMRKRIPRIGP